MNGYVCGIAPLLHKDFSMFSKIRFLPPVIVVACMLSVCRSAAGDDGPSKAGHPAVSPAATDGPSDKSLREQDIYIPYEKLRQVFEKHGRGRVPPLRKVSELWRAAQEKTQPAAAPKPPVGAVITEIDNEATVEKDVVRVKAKLRIEVLAEGWTGVPLRLTDAAITAATLGGKPARIVGGAGQDYRLLVEKKGKKAEADELDLEYAKAISQVPGMNSVSFQAPQAPVSRWRVRIPQAGVKVNLHPLIAATEVPAGRGERPSRTAAKSQARRNGRAGLRRRRPRGAHRLDAQGRRGHRPGRLGQRPSRTASLDHRRGRPQPASTLGYAISRAELGQLVIDVPADQKVVNVFDANVRQWSVEPAAPAGKRRITAQLFEPAKARSNGHRRIGEILPAERPQRSITVPVVKAVGVGRQQGVRGGPGGRGAAGRGRAAERAAAGRCRRSCRTARAAREVDLRLPLCRRPLRIGARRSRRCSRGSTVDSLVEAELQPERLTLEVAVIYNIERAGVFKLELDVPPGYAVRQVRGCDVASRDPAKRAVAAHVDSHHLEGRRTGWWSISAARLWDASLWPSSCRRTCRRRTCSCRPAKRPIFCCRCRRSRPPPSSGRPAGCWSMPRQVC